MTPLESTIALYEENDIDFNDIPDLELSNIEDDEIQFIKLDLDDEVSEVIARIRKHIAELG